ncbi:hypothetical protein ATE84_0816 [Aquimarina sp. MAR_2010_214]|uniref:hypothetical protein n=1 Tax=Aquimarina sp. MAR_2010_214 TaxID=1250026 RepID=UPI000C70DBB0|nr:hypothetical protein [Aquimarina sp. MAR_2010_214]PKV48803.1 hypothetical protein ATE84_0816 [Aquimarina sp. MAR_2010_214]
MKNKLTKEDIQFIDTYLSNSEIHYEDIRIELIDHVASEIEDKINQGDTRDFYYIFKDFMVQNKTFLEKQGSKSFNWKIFRSVTKQFLKNMYSWQVILGSVFCFWIFKNIYSYFHIESVMRLFFPTFLIVMVMFIPLFVFGKKKFSFIGNFGALMSFFFALNYYTVPYIEESSLFSYINLGIMTFFFVCSLKTMLSLVMFYKKRFEIV